MFLHPDQGNAQPRSATVFAARLRVGSDMIELVRRLFARPSNINVTRESYLMTYRTLGFAAILALVLPATNTMASTLPSDIPRLDRSREITMALSAAPPELRTDAGVYVLERSGFVLVRASRNGFNCLVERDIHVIAPVCYDAEGSRTTLQASLERARLRASGIDGRSVDRMIDAEYRAGRLKPPAKPGIAYMLSRDFVKLDPKTGKATPLYPPHVMVYAPFLRNEDIGVPKQFVRSTTHVWVEAPGKPDACLVFTSAVSSVSGSQPGVTGGGRGAGVARRIQRANNRSEASTGRRTGGLQVPGAVVSAGKLQMPAQAGKDVDR